jgi:hypothetical protein
MRFTKFSYLIITTCLCTMSNVSLGAMSKQEIIRDAGIDNVCKVRPYLDCLNLTKSACESAVKKCVSHFPDVVQENEVPKLYEDFDKCMDSALKVDNQKMLACEAQLEGDLAMDQGQDYFNEQESQSAVVFTSNDDVLNAIESAGIPIYDSSQMVTFIDEAQAVEMAPGAEAPLPAAVFASEDEYDDVVEYYASQLSGYKQYSLDDNKVLFIKDGPDTFDFLENYMTYFSKQHVLIEKTDGPIVLAPQGTKTKIEISYQQ